MTDKEKAELITLIGAWLPGFTDRTDLSTPYNMAVFRRSLNFVEHRMSETEQAFADYKTDLLLIEAGFAPATNDNTFRM